MTPREKFQDLLRELFQFDLADLDFGIYRIMNHKRQVIERWIREDLPRSIEQKLRQGALAEQDKAQKALEEARRRVLDTLGQGAIDAEGNLAEAYVNTPLGKAYLEARERAAHASSSEALEAAVYNHLYAFFSRYYQDGDFISQRRYSKKERYAIPYNGEEVTLYWANHDQYYVKTAEHFSDYTWKAPGGVTVHFKLQAADVEQNNVKGEKRFFLPVLDGLAWDEATRTLTLPFAYRPLTPQEEKVYGAKNQQEAILKQAIQDISARLTENAQALTALTAERRKDAKGSPISYLEHHLRQYTARNTRDFFIHKDLKGFLSRELDFYLKNEVLNLDELEAAGEGLAEGWFQTMRLIKRVGNAIIDFLAQIEEFQKALWEKKKFITETFYCISVGNIPEDFYPEIAENEAQWEEWRQLLCLHETGEDRLAFLKAHPSLVLDTRHFPQDFTDRLLARFENLDEATDGLLIHSENWQALNLLLEKYRERVKCVYIDPPYNTGNDDFLYRDNYQHSSWLTMMQNRLQTAIDCMAKGSLIYVSIDDREQSTLHELMKTLFGPKSSIGPIIWSDAGSIQNTDQNIAILHEYIEAFRLSSSNTEVVNRRQRKLDKDEKELLRAWGQNSRRQDRPTMFYPIPSPFGDIYPIRPDGTEGCWQVGKEVAFQLLKDNLLIFEQDDETGRVEVYRRIPKGTIRYSPYGSVLSGVGGSGQGTKDLIKLMGKKIPDLTAKPTRLIYHLIRLVKDQDASGIFLDYFAGSGTTGHAVINLNREDGGRRRFILVEMGEYFDTVLLPRLKKVTFSPEWKDGAPKRPATQEEFERGPRIIKVLRLESYEDALNNIAFDETGSQHALKFEDYLLRYMLRWEARKSETLLDVEKLQRPFSYQLHIHQGGETRLQPVDLPETLNYLIGLDVQTRRVLPSPTGRGAGGEGRYLVYRGTLRNGRKVAILWRETEGWTQADYERDAAFVAEQKLTDGAEEIFVNGDSFIPGAQSLDGVFKARLFGGKEV